MDEWLEAWLEKAVKPSRRINTYTTYAQIIARSLKPALGTIRLQALRPLDVQAYCAAQTIGDIALTRFAGGGSPTF